MNFLQMVPWGTMGFFFNDTPENKKSLTQTEDKQNFSEEIQSDSE